jgi:hypothetical protein
MLHFPRGKWTHRAGRGNAWEIRSRPGVPLYQLFYDSDKPPALPNILKRKSAGEIAWGSSGKDARMLERFRQLLSRTKEGDRKLLLFMAQKMARGKTAASASAE